MVFATAPSTVQRADITPTFDAILPLFNQGDLVPVYRRLLADLETPVSVFIKLTQNNHPAFLLESVEGGEKVGRYSFLGVNPKGMISFKDGEVTRTYNGETTTFPLADGQDPLHVLQAEINRYKPVELDGLPRFVGGAVGYFAYDIVRYFEKLPQTAKRELDLPDAVFLLPDTLVIFDHVKHQLIILANAHNTGDPAEAYQDAVNRIEAITDIIRQPLPLPRPTPAPRGENLVSNITKDVYEANVLRAKEHIKAGDAFQIVLSQRFTCQTSAEPFEIYRALRALNPSPYMFYLHFGGDFTLLGASPEMMVRYEDGIATTRPIAGTRKRGKDEAEDNALIEDLLADPKEIAEHVMLVDLGRNDLGRVCDYGTVKVTRMMTIEKYSHVMHIVSQVDGKLRGDYDAFALFRATFPAGTLSGAPKIRAMEIIEDLEGTRRGAYGGAVGYFSYDGSMDTCITIRSLVVQGDRVYLQAGGGLVADSNPTAEYEESINKAKAVAVAIHYAEQGLK
ncbi:MAG: anthranilate synthase component I [Anaerolineae bacterium]|nr:anthranilate synthase component I [Anaerolineae bacterium]